MKHMSNLNQKNKTLSEKLKKQEQEFLDELPRTVDDLGNLNIREIHLLWMIRHKYRFGKMTIECRDGLPVHIIQTIERQKL